MFLVLDLIRGKDLSISPNPPERVIAYNSFNKPKSIRYITSDRTIRTSIGYDGDGRRVLKFVDSKTNSLHTTALH